jgi:hypothetical protein
MDLFFDAELTFEKLEPRTEGFAVREDAELYSVKPARRKLKW